MAKITGGYREYDMSDEVFESLPDTSQLLTSDEQIFIKKVIEEVDDNVGKGFLLMLLDYSKTDIAYMLGYSRKWIYKIMIPQIQGSYTKMKENQKDKDV